MNSAYDCNNHSVSHSIDQVPDFDSINLKPISESCIDSNENSAIIIGPEDFKWSTELHRDATFNEKICNSSEGCRSVYELGCGKGLFHDSTSDYKIRTLDNFAYGPLGKNHECLTGNSFITDEDTCSKDFQITENKCSQLALNRLYQSGKNAETNDQSIKLEGNDYVDFEESLDLNRDPPVDDHRSSYNSQPSDSFHERKTSLHAETISLITNGIVGEFPAEDPPFSNDQVYDDLEQVVPTATNEYPYENGYSGIHLSTQEQYSTNYGENETEHQVYVSEDKGEQLKEEEPEIKKKKILADFSATEPCAFTPSGQIYRLVKEQIKDQNTKENSDQTMLEIAMEINWYKKKHQIQIGKLIPEGLDFNKEEEFNDKFRKDKEKAEALFEKFDVKLNTRNLAVERELLKLDRRLKQYILTNPSCALEELKLIETFDITLIDLVHISQVYETLSKVPKISDKESLVKKVGTVLKKIKALIATPRGSKVGDHLKKLGLNENISKLNTAEPIECIIHLLQL